MSLLAGQAQAGQSDMASLIDHPRYFKVHSWMELSSRNRSVLNWANAAPRKEVLRTSQGTK